MWWLIVLVVVLVAIGGLIARGRITRRSRMDELFDGSSTAREAARANFKNRMNGPSSGAGMPPF